MRGGVPGWAAVAAAIALAWPGRAAADAKRPWYLPDQAKLQFAGNVGFLSPGIGYAWKERRLELDWFFGWVPRAVVTADEEIVSFTGKLTWQPWELPTGGRWHLRPFSMALQLTYTFGGEHYLSLPARYPRDYYDFVTAVRAGVGFGGTFVRRTRGALREVGVYWEFVALDAMLVMWVRNRDALGPQDVFSLALGLRIAL